MKKPLCISCDHHYRITEGGALWCDLPWRISLATGKAVHMDCEHQRSADGMCKPHALKFIPIEGEAIQYLDEPKVEGSPF